MSSATVLPTRRVEAWKYSDLSAALSNVVLPTVREGVDIIEGLSGGAKSMTVPPGAQATEIDRYGDAALDARAFSADVGQGAMLTRIVIQARSGGVPLSTVRVRLAAGATYRQFVLAEGARLARIETHVSVEGEGATVELNGVYMVGRGLHADLTSTIHHACAGGVTRQLVKGVARAGGRGVFQGRILVAPYAQKTDARQNHHALLLEDGAEVFAKPELEIHADDVQCAHGNTVGGLDAEALFYIRQRGVPESEARALLVEAFLGEAISDGLPEDLQREILDRIRAWLGATS
ncbi:MAG: SufD family Fe-S cluster assembly protein [Hyphomonadaceae bacterium]|nr:MAG: Fe-S cluster assembly protein SufD [Caulobacteraceae bacterium]MBT9444924.1 SufD family Fe-S cluster assembly protein [Hyphomonadaceae bacterium]TPW06912.1 MAG: Fe-S cluster assembly protein SufD [Alphaproteobacteria bacterium]